MRFRFDVWIGGEQLRIEIEIHRCVKFFQPVHCLRLFSDWIQAEGGRLPGASQRGYKAMIYAERRNRFREQSGLTAAFFCQAVCGVIRFRVTNKQ